MSSISNPIQGLTNVLIKPNAVFSTLAKANNWSWLPFILINLVTLFTIYSYFNHIDFNWYIETIISETMANTSPAEQDAVRSSMNPSTMIGIGAGGAIFGVVIVNAILAVYLNSMTKNDDSHVQGFSDWYGALWWTQMPTIVSSLIAIALLLMSSSNEISPTSLSPLSLGFILGTNMGSDWYNFMTSIRLDTVWSIYLLTSCIAQWTQFNTRKSLIIASAPFVIISSIWLAYLLF
ncbi:YIP1 family protein [Alteromonas sp. 5E99-2]|uniref:YIP1 family protein n=1 Tax=Alteromonas sp. 5E99-2 TaxID=2817683 RepID=UPI001A99F90A|nr:YIP1 family protein [Alteromonas sp. 5E99-2]MBO1256043.1 YIP1 family protein [Alteromonas sp. 5E99-2]